MKPRIRAYSVNYDLWIGGAYLTLAIKLNPELIKHDKGGEKEEGT